MAKYGKSKKGYGRSSGRGFRRGGRPPKTKRRWFVGGYQA